MSFAKVGAIFATYPELLPLTVNVIMAGVAASKGEFGKMTYWIGASILTVGIMLMRG